LAGRNLKYAFVSAIITARERLVNMLKILRTKNLQESYGNIKPKNSLG